MAEIKEFVINDRRKFTPEGDLRPDAPPSEPRPPRPETQLEPESSARLVDAPPRETKPTPTSSPAQPPAAASQPSTEEEPSADHHPDDQLSEDQLPPPPTAEQTQQATRAYDATVDRLDTAIRATNPDMERLPEMTFERVVQSLYMQAILQLGGGAEPGQQPQVDILGARQTIDMLAIIESKTKGNLSDTESRLIDSALFESRMAFLEVTQALARQAQTRQQPGAPGTPNTPPPVGPRIVR